MGRVIHFEIPADSPERAKKFYEDCFGWDIKNWGGPIEYWLITTGKEEPGIDGAIMRREKSGGDLEQFFAYLCTIDVVSIDEAIEKIKNAGGKIITEKMPIPGIGVMAYCRDTENNKFGILQEEKKG